MVRSHGLLALLTFAVFGVLGANNLCAEVPTEFQPNYDQGYGIGYPIGHRLGLIEGKDRGWRVGTETGTSVGFNTGWSAAYSPAYDLAYDAQYPVGHRAGWDDGVFEGFEEGFDYAPVIAAILNSEGNWTNWGGGASSGNLSISGGSFFSEVTISYIDNSREPLDYDWGKHFYNEGYSTGRDAGYSVGSTEGYNQAYPIAYARAYKIAFIDGVGMGTLDGTRDGGDEGYDEGWDEGYDGGFDEVFYAGIDYHLLGDFVEPTYSFAYVRRSNAFTSQTLLALHAPEPTSLVLVGLVAGAGLMVRTRRAQ
jgi:hypothetical protein